MANNLGVFNPFRYRGYIYDEETGLYYLQSRYYDPAVGRFLNADGYVATGEISLSHNMYAYCENNPVMYVDPNGYFAGILKGMVDAALDVIKMIAVIKYEVTSFGQGEEPLCWAYCQAMIDYYHAGDLLKDVSPDEYVYNLACIVNGKDNWNTSARPTNGSFLLKVDSAFDLYKLLVKTGPLYAEYMPEEGIIAGASNIKGSKNVGHMVVVTGVDVYHNTVHVINPQGENGRYGIQSFGDFCNNYYANNGTPMSLNGVRIAYSRWEWWRRK